MLFQCANRDTGAALKSGMTVFRTNDRMAFVEVNVQISSIEGIPPQIIRWSFQISWIIFSSALGFQNRVLSDLRSESMYLFSSSGLR